jgi:hypothetical protein
LLRQRYTDYIQEHPREVRGAKPVERPLPGLSGLRQVTHEESHWVHQRLQEAERVLFLNAGGCRYCHQVEPTGKGWQLTPPGLPRRWLTSSKFSHFNHRLYPQTPPGEENCTACHEAARSSSRTSDVLIPSIQTCRSCHGVQNLPHSGRADCMECHTYHNEVGGRPKESGLFSLKNGLNR